MREIARVSQGFFPTQNRIVPGAVAVLDAGYGTGKAIHDLRETWLTPDLNVTLLGIESDKNRCQQAVSLLTSRKCGGTALWSAIEDAAIDHPVSLLWFNPPYDRIQANRVP